MRPTLRRRLEDLYAAIATGNIPLAGSSTAYLRGSCGPSWIAGQRCTQAVVRG